VQVQSSNKRPSTTPNEMANDDRLLFWKHQSAAKLSSMLTPPMPSSLSNLYVTVSLATFHLEENSTVVEHRYGTASLS